MSDAAETSPTDSAGPSAEESPARPHPAALEEPGRAQRAWESVQQFLRLAYQKAAEDNIFFLAGAIAFNVLVAFIPLVLAVLGIAGTILRMQETNGADVVIDLIMRSLPNLGEDFRTGIRNPLESMLDRSTGILSIGMIFFAWIATRLVGTLRTVLREVFDIHQDRGIVAGKLFDLKMVLAAGTLFAVSLGLTFGVGVVARFGKEALGLQGGTPQYAEILWAQTLAFIITWVMFLLVYQYLPARRVSWRTSVIAATFTAVIFELLKQGFSWYATNLANYQSTYGGLFFLIALTLWIYYMSVVFILGGEVAQVRAMQRVRRRQKERLS